MKKFVFLISLFLLTLALCGFCQEHTWQDASCTEPKTCTVCGETEGEALGHDWIPADCTTARTCARCGELSGSPKGHKWQAADCEHPKTCSVCGETEGKALGHSWERATCAHPKTCTRCGQTEGEALEHQWIVMSCTEPRVCLLCREKEDAEAPGHTWIDADYTHPKTCEVCGTTSGAPLSFKVCGTGGYTVTAGEYIEAYEAFLNSWAIWPYEKVNTCTVEKLCENDKFFSILLSGDDLPEEVDGIFTGFTLILTDKGMPVTDPNGRFDTVTVKYSHITGGYTAKNSIELYLYMTGVIHLSDAYFPFAEDSSAYAELVCQRFIDTDLPKYKNIEYLGNNIYTFKADLCVTDSEYLFFEAAFNK